MPSAADVVTEERLRFVLTRAAGPRRAAPTGPAPRPRRRHRGPPRDPRHRARPRPSTRLQLVIVGAYYTDRDVRERIGYPGQVAITVRSWEYPPYLEEGLIDAVLARGPVWRDPATGSRAEAADAPRTYAERYGAPPEGDTDGHDGA